MNKKKKSFLTFIPRQLQYAFFACVLLTLDTHQFATRKPFSGRESTVNTYIIYTYNIKIYSAIWSRTLKIIVQGIYGCQKYRPKGYSCVLFLFLFDQHGTFKNAQTRVLYKNFIFSYTIERGRQCQSVR